MRKATIRDALRGIGAVADGKAPRWSHVGNLFSVGSTNAMQMCRDNDVDPHEQVGRDKCKDCPLAEEVSP